MTRRSSIRMIPACLFIVLACAACDLRQDISFDEPPEAPPEGPALNVVWEENRPNGVNVSLDNLEKVAVEGGTVWLVWDVLLAAGLEEEEILAMRFDFEGEDGYRPSSKPGCGPRAGEDLALAYLDLEPDGLALRWDAGLGLRGCYRVSRLARIFGEPG